MAESLFIHMEDMTADKQLEVVTDPSIEATLESFSSSIHTIREELIDDAVGLEIHIGSHYSEGVRLLVITGGGWGYFRGATREELYPVVMHTGKEFLAESDFHPDHPRYCGSIESIMHDYLRGNIHEQYVSVI